MSDQQAFFAQLAALLRDSGIPFMMSGSVASSFHGEPRATNDFDLVIDPTAAALEQFLDSAPTSWYVSKPAAQEALRQRSMFNIIDMEGCWKADLIVRKNRPFSVEEFRRRIPALIFGSEVSVVTPEDSILSKLDWSRESGSEHQYRDAVGVAMLNGKSLDRVYLRRWAMELGVEKSLARLLDEADQLRSNSDEGDSLRGNRS